MLQLGLEIVELGDEILLLENGLVVFVLLGASDFIGNESPYSMGYLVVGKSNLGGVGADVYNDTPVALFQELLDVLGPDLQGLDSVLH